MRKIEETEDKEDKSWGQEVMYKLWSLPSMFLALYRSCVPSPYVRASGNASADLVLDADVQERKQ